MLSRVSDSLYWMSRYLERAENTARVIGVHLNLELEQPPDASLGRWARVMGMLGLNPLPAIAVASRGLTHDLCFENENRASIVSCIKAARDNARQVREQISSEMWEQLNRLYHEVQRADQQDAKSAGPESFLDSIKEGAHLFQGVTDSTMSHGESWHFIQLGRFLERAGNLASLLDVHFKYFSEEAAMRPDAGPEAADYLEWIGLLKCATAFEAYCKVYTATIAADRVAEFLLLNDTFPHSIRFAADMVESALSAIAEVSPSRRATRVLRLAGRLKASLSFTQIDEVMSGDLHSTLSEMQNQCGAIHSGIYQAFISYPIEAALEA